jgi:hypothetical protein
MASIKTKRNYNTIVQFDGLDCDYNPDTKVLKIEIPAQHDQVSMDRLITLCKQLHLRDSQIEEVIVTLDNFQVMNYIEGHRSRG